MCLTLLQYTGQSTIPPSNPGFIREMANQVETLPYTSPSIHDDIRGSPPVKEKKPSLPSLLSLVVVPFIRLVYWSPFLATVTIATIPAAIIAGVVNRAFFPDKQNPYRQIPRNGSGVSGVTSPSWVLADDVLQVALIGRGHRLDPDNRSLSISWEVVGCGAYKLTTYPLEGGILEDAGCDALDRAADVYLNAWVYIRCRGPRSTH